MGSKKALFVVIGIVSVLALVVVSAASAEDATYVSNKQCKICHNSKENGEIWTSWKAEKHAKALEALSSDKAKEVATKLKLEKAPNETPKCLACHVTGYDEAKGAAPETIAKEDGVQCESCHGPASLHIADGKKYKTTKDASIDIAAHINMKPDEKTCAKCHNDKNPTYNPERYTTADGKKADFDFKQAWEKIKHSNPSKTKK